MRVSLVMIVLHFYACIVYGQFNSGISSPNRDIERKLKTEPEGGFSYAAMYKKQPVIQPSRLGFTLHKPQVDLNLNKPNTIKSTDWIVPQKFIGVWWEMYIVKGTWYLASSKHADWEKYFEANVIKKRDVTSESNREFVFAKCEGYAISINKNEK